jgi:hypothetical protein
MQKTLGVLFLIMTFVMATGLIFYSGEFASHGEYMFMWLCVAGFGWMSLRWLD